MISIHEGNGPFDDARKTLRVHHGEIPDDNGAPVVTDEEGLLIAEVVEETDKIVR